MSVPVNERPTGQFGASDDLPQNGHPSFASGSTIGTSTAVLVDSSCCVEVWVVNEAHDRVLGSAHSRRDDVVAHVSWRSVLGCSCFDGGANGSSDIINTPVGQCSVFRRALGEEPEFVTGNVVSDVERLIEVRFGAEKPSPPRLGSVEVGSRVDDGP